jgi:hypothetical protein
MRTSRVGYKRIIDRATLQLQGIKDRPDLAKGMPYSVAHIEAVLAALSAALSMQKRLSNSGKLATSRLRRAMNEMAAKVRANVAYASSVFGANSAELIDLGGTPRKRIQPVVDTVVESSEDPSPAPMIAP